MKMKTYPIVVEKMNESGWYLVRCISIKGLSSFGPDIDECWNEILVATQEIFQNRGQKIIASLDKDSRTLRVILLS